MRCGAKCYLVQIEGVDGEKRTEQINARTPVEARKFFRKQYGSEVAIVSVQEKKRTK